VKYFTLDLEAAKTAKLLNLNRKTVNNYYRKIRQAIATYQENTTQFTGEVELDESYFEDKRKGVDKRVGSIFTYTSKSVSFASITEH